MACLGGCISARCGRGHARPIAAATPCVSENAPWPVIQALVAAGHVLPKHINQFARACKVHDAPLSAVRWWLQQGMTFDDEMLLQAARCGRVDILQLAHSIHMRGRVRITAAMITAAAQESKWQVLVWACRNGVPVDDTLMEQLQSLKPIDDNFAFAKQKAELVSLLRRVRECGPDVALRKKDADGAKRAQKSRNLKR